MARRPSSRHGLGERNLPWAVGILPARKAYPADVTLPLPTQKVYPADVTLSCPAREATGRPRKHPVPSAVGVGVAAAELIEARPAAFRAISWRTGTKGPPRAELAPFRVRVADGPATARAQHLPGEEAWLVGEHRANGERKSYLANRPADTPPEVLAALIKARWVCEQAHQQMKGELGLGHFEGRSRAALSTARPAPPHAFVPARLRLPAAPAARGKKRQHPARPGPPPGPSLPAIRRRIVAALPHILLRCPHCRQRFSHHLQL